MKSHDRSPDQTVLGISMSKTLKARIAKAAEADDRTMANWCVAHLKRIIEQHEAEHGVHRPAAPPGPQIVPNPPPETRQKKA